MFEYRKYGNGSQCYEVFVGESYNEITKIVSYKSLGFVQKIGKQWEGLYSNKGITGKTRKEIAAKLAK